MIAGAKGARLLRGFRGRPASDLEALEDTLVRVSYPAMHMEGHLAQLDINRLMVLPSGQGVKAAVELVMLRGKSQIYWKTKSTPNFDSGTLIYAIHGCCGSAAGVLESTLAEGVSCECPGWYWLRLLR